MKFKQNEDLYREILMKTKDEVSDSLNNKLNIHNEKLQSLKSLIINGEVNYKYAQKLNDILVKELTNERNNNQEEAPISLRSLRADEALELIDLFKNRLDTTANEAPSYFFNFFKEEMHKKFFSFDGDIVNPKCLITIKEPKSTESPNFDDLIDDYISNYTKILHNNHNLQWNKNSLKKYSEYVESMVYRQTGDDSVLADKIYEAVDNMTMNVLSIEEAGILNLEQKEIILRQINYALNELIEGQNRDIDNMIESTKNMIVNKINTLFERANKEVFPSIIKVKMDKIRDGEMQDVLKLTDLITDLEEERDHLMNVLYIERIDSFKNYMEGYIEDSVIKDAIEESELYTSIFLSSNSDLALFMSERNVYSSVIEKQLSTEDGSYFKILEEIKKINTELSEGKETLLIYFYQSIELFASELKETVLGVMDIKFMDFKTGNFRDIANQHQRNLGKLKSILKTNLLIFINDFKTKLNAISEEDLLEHIKKTRKLEFIQGDENALQFLFELNHYILSQIKFNEEEKFYFLNNKSTIEHTLQYDEDFEHSRLTFNIIAALFTGAAGVLAVTTGGLGLAVALGIAGTAPSIWEKFNRNKDFYETKYKEFLTQYLNHVKMGLLVNEK